MKLLKTQKIPTIIGLVIILIGLGVSIFLVKRSQSLFLKAKTGFTPNQVKTSNITSNSFVISWFTAKPTVGFVKAGQGAAALGLEVRDERDLELDKKHAYFSHYVSLTNLEPSTTYHFEIHSNSEKFTDDGKPYRVTTGPATNKPQPQSDLAYGLILDTNGRPAEDTIVYLNLANSSLQSSLVSSSGNWAIPLNLVLTDDFSDFISYDPEASALEIFVQGKDQTASAISTTSKDSPVPPITMGENFDFRQIAKTEAEEKESLPSGFSLDDPLIATSAFFLSITNPEAGEAVSTERPEFLGKGPTGEEITIKVESPLLTGKITPNEWGDWNWSPSEKLPAGEHKITISYTDDQGKIHEIFHHFTVLAADDSDLPAFTATPSAEPTTEPSPEPTTEPSPEPSSTPEPTTAAAPTETPTPTAELSPSPTGPTPTGAITTPILSPTATPIPSEEIEAGLITPTLIIFIIGVILLSSGLLSTTL